MMKKSKPLNSFTSFLPTNIKKMSDKAVADSQNKDMFDFSKYSQYNPGKYYNALSLGQSYERALRDKNFRSNYKVPQAYYDNREYINSVMAKLKRDKEALEKYMSKPVTSTSPTLSNSQFNLVKNVLNTLPSITNFIKAKNNPKVGLGQKLMTGAKAVDDLADSYKNYGDAKTNYYQYMRLPNAVIGGIEGATKPGVDTSSVVGKAQQLANIVKGTKQGFQYYDKKDPMNPNQNIGLKDMSGVFGNLGWKQREANQPYSILGTKGALDLYDIANFLGTAAVDPANIAAPAASALGKGVGAGVRAAGRGVQAARPYGQALVDTVAQNAKNTLSSGGIPSFQGYSRNLQQRLAPDTGGTGGTPKNNGGIYELLESPAAKSLVDNLTSGDLQLVLNSQGEVSPSKVSTLLFGSSRKLAATQKVLDNLTEAAFLTKQNGAYRISETVTNNYKPPAPAPAPVTTPATATTPLAEVVSKLSSKPDYEITDADLSAIASQKGVSVEQLLLDYSKNSNNLIARRLIEQGLIKIDTPQTSTAVEIPQPQRTQPQTQKPKPKSVAEVEYDKSVSLAKSLKRVPTEDELIKQLGLDPQYAKIVVKKIEETNMFPKPTPEPTPTALADDVATTPEPQVAEPTPTAIDEPKATTFREAVELILKDGGKTISIPRIMELMGVNEAEAKNLINIAKEAGIVSKVGGRINTKNIPQNTTPTTPATALDEVAAQAIDEVPTTVEPTPTPTAIDEVPEQVETPTPQRTRTVKTWTPEEMEEFATTVADSAEKKVTKASARRVLKGSRISDKDIETVVARANEIRQSRVVEPTAESMIDDLQRQLEEAGARQQSALANDVETPTPTASETTPTPTAIDEPVTTALVPASKPYNVYNPVIPKLDRDGNVVGAAEFRTDGTATQNPVNIPTAAEVVNLQRVAEIDDQIDYLEDYLSASNVEISVEELSAIREAISNLRAEQDAILRREPSTLKNTVDETVNTESLSPTSEPTPMRTPNMFEKWKNTMRDPNVSNFRKNAPLLAGAGLGGGVGAGMFLSAQQEQQAKSDAAKAISDTTKTNEQVAQNKMDTTTKPFADEEEEMFNYLKERNQELEAKLLSLTQGDNSGFDSMQGGESLMGGQDMSNLQSLYQPVTQDQEFMKQLSSQITDEYNRLMGGYDSRIGDLRALQDADLNTLRQNRDIENRKLDDNMFQRYMQTQENMNARGLLSSGLMADATAKTDMARKDAMADIAQRTQEQIGQTNRYYSPLMNAIMAERQSISPDAMLRDATDRAQSQRAQQAQLATNYLQMVNQMKQADRDYSLRLREFNRKFQEDAVSKNNTENANNQVKFYSTQADKANKLASEYEKQINSGKLNEERQKELQLKSTQLRGLAERYTDLSNEIFMSKTPVDQATAQSFLAEPPNTNVPQSTNLGKAKLNKFLDVDVPELQRIVGEGVTSSNWIDPAEALRRLLAADKTGQLGVPIPISDQALLDYQRYADGNTSWWKDTSVLGKLTPFGSDYNKLLERKKAAQEFMKLYNQNPNRFVTPTE